MTNAEARFNNSLRPRKPEGSLGRTAQDVHLDSHTAPELGRTYDPGVVYVCQVIVIVRDSDLCCCVSCNTCNASAVTPLKALRLCT